MNSESVIQVLIADDHPFVREGLRHVVNREKDMKVVAEAANGAEAISAVRALSPAVVLLDVSLPDVDGVVVTSTLAEQYPAVKVVAVTWHNEYGFVKRLLEAGAAGFVSKQSAATRLADAIRAAARGRQYIDPSVRGAPDSTFESAPSIAHQDLSGEDEQMLRLVASGLTNREIAEQLQLSTSAAVEAKARAMRNANLVSRAQVVRYAESRGWR